MSEADLIKINIKKGKFINTEDALNMIKDNYNIVTGMASMEAKEILSKIHNISDRVKNVNITTCLAMSAQEYYINKDYSQIFNIEGWFYNGAMRKAHSNGNLSFIPNHLHLSAVKRLHCKKFNMYIGAASMPDKHGYISLSLSNVYEKRMIESADIVILEVNPNMPRTFGDVEIHISEIDYMVKVNYEVSELSDSNPNEKDLIIGKLIGDKINDGDCIQLGIGGIPNAVTASLMNKKNLGIHTEMFTNGMMNLIKAGVVNGKKKNFNRGKHVAAFALGTKELYEFLDENTSVMIMDGNWTNDPYIIGQNDNQVSINTTIEIDLVGQCASESIGHMQFSGTGGQADTAIGAQRSKNGRSFIALYSTTMVKNKETGKREKISKIVPFLKQGATVSLSRNDVDYVVTEYGIADLRGTSIRERVEKLIAIAHPDFREDLYIKAVEMQIIN